MRKRSNIPQLRHIRRRYLKLYAAALLLLDTEINENNFDNLTEALLDIIPDVNSEIVALSCSYLIGKKLIKSEISELCWRLSANYKTMLNGEPATPWAGQRLDDDCIAQILDVQASRTAESVVHLTIRVLTGVLAAAKFCINIKKHMLCRLAIAAGFTKISGKYPFSPQKLHELKRLLFCCRIVPAVSVRSCRMYISSFVIYPSCVKYNRRIIRARQRAIGCVQYKYSKCITCNKQTCPAFGGVFLDGD